MFYLTVNVRLLVRYEKWPEKKKWLAIVRSSVFRYVCYLVTHFFLMMHAINFMLHCICLKAIIVIFICTTINYRLGLRIC